MPSLRITKYDPRFRNSEGHYLRDDWTSVSDIGSVHAGKQVTVQDYKLIEDAYILAVTTLMESLGIECLQLVDYESHGNRADLPDSLTNESRSYAIQFSVENVLQGSDLKNLLRSVLREQCWCKLQGKHGFYVHFGYDFYMYVGYDDSVECDWQVPEHLYCEEFKSPYST